MNGSGPIHFKTSMEKSSDFEKAKEQTDSKIQCLTKETTPIQNQKHKPEEKSSKKAWYNYIFSTPRKVILSVHFPPPRDLNALTNHSISTFYKQIKPAEKSKSANRNAFHKVWHIFWEQSSWNLLCWSERFRFCWADNFKAKDNPMYVSTRFFLSCMFISCLAKLSSQEFVVNV